MVSIFQKKDPFDPTGLEGLSVSEQERVLTKIATREAELIESKEKPAKQAKESRKKKAVEQRVKQLEKQKGFSQLRAKLIKEEAARQKARKEKAKTPVRQRLREIAPTITKRGLSPLQRKILQRERVLAFLKRTPPMDRARALNKSSEFQRARDAIRGVDSLEQARKGSGITSFEDSPAQQAQARLREKMLSATPGERQLTTGGIIQPRLRAAPRLL